jgi:hypothetical protein
VSDGRVDAGVYSGDDGSEGEGGGY